MKDSHPDGMPFKLVDASDRPYDAGFKAFSGHAARLDGRGGGGQAPGPGSGGEGGGRSIGGGSTEGTGGGNVSSLDEGAAGGVRSRNGNKRADYLNKLPSAIIRNGKVIEVRSEIEAMLGGGTNNSTKSKSPEVSVIDTHLDRALPMDFLSRPNRRKSSSTTSSSPSTSSASSSSPPPPPSTSTSTSGVARLAAAAAQKPAGPAAPAASAAAGEVTPAIPYDGGGGNDGDDQVTTLRVKGMDGFRMYIIRSAPIT